MSLIAPEAILPLIIYFGIAFGALACFAMDRYEKKKKQKEE